jgi:1-aminocyclopropane-1-carboxylate deaminase/D-cysteine desulfhydrase-like pyridoxal-dependent ACC family enzyme
MVVRNTLPTPVEQAGGIYVKRDDLFEVCGVHGGKARSASFLVGYAISMGFTHIVTAGSRHSPQVEIVGSICEHYGLDFTAFVPDGELSEHIESLKSFANIQQVPFGRNTVIKHKAQVFSYQNGAFLVPFGMECIEAVYQTASQVANIPADVQRIVIPVGSAMSLCGVLHGLNTANRRIPVLGVSVGANPDRVMKTYAPAGWESFCKIVKSPLDYSKEVIASIGSITLDPVYEAKTLPYLKQRDLLWVVGCRKSAAQPNY